MIDRYLLRYFLAVVDQGNFSRAAAHCNVAQPTLSVGIAKLERELGTALLFRSNQRVELTDAGSRFLTHARKIESEFNLAQASSRANAPVSPTMRLGFLTSIPVPVVARAIRTMRERAGDQPVELLFGTERELVGNLARGRIDAAVTLCKRGSDRFLELPVRTESYELTLPAMHRFAGEREISAEGLGSEVMIVRRHCELLAQTSRFFTDRGVRPRFSLRSHNDEQVIQMVAAGLGITIMPASFTHTDIVRVKLSGFNFERTLGFVFAHGAEHLRHAPHPLMEAVEIALEFAPIEASAAA